MKLLEQLCAVHAPSGEEVNMKKFLLQYIENESKNWKVKPEIHESEELLDNIILSFGKPRTAIFAHMDSVGFTARYENQLVPIGGPDTENPHELSGEDDMGPIACKLNVNNKDQLTHNFSRPIQRGTSLTFAPNFRNTDDYIQSPYLDNRLGIFNALEVCKDLENGLVVFSCFEEHGGGAVPMLMQYIYERWKIRQTLVSDITWITDGVQHGEGVVISLRDRNIPRKPFINRIIEIAAANKIKFQLEVEGAGSSDGREIHQSPYPVNWCFIGAPEDNVHSPDEKVHKEDIKNMISIYKVLMKEL